MRRVLLPFFIFGFMLVPLAVHKVTAAPAKAGCVTCLGKPTNDLWDGHFPLSGYQRYGKPWHSHFRLELLIMSSFADDANAETWPLVKTLDQFGAWMNAQPAAPFCANVPNQPATCGPPGFDLGHARYRSRYLSLVSRQLYDGHGHCLGHLPRAEEALLHHFHYTFGVSPYSKGQACWNSPGGTAPAPFPLVLVGGYLQTGAQIVTGGDFEVAVGAPPPGQPGEQRFTGLPFQTVHDILASGNDPKYKTTIYDVNAEANLITAIICHADGKQPRSACGRSVIKQLLRKVK